jgi:hypothetical protein
MNGNLKSLGLLWANLATTQRYSDYVQKEDLLLFERRLRNEGVTFLTTCLPNIGKALDRFHSSYEWIPPGSFTTRDVFLEFSYADVSFRGVFDVPVFLGKAVELALKGDSLAVDCVRQLTLLFYKLEMHHAEETENAFLDRFIQTDQELGSFWDRVHSTKTGPRDQVDPDSSLRELLLDYMATYIWRVLRNEDPQNIVPRHGTGVTACKTPNWEKYHRFSYYEKLDTYYPYSSHFFFSPTHLADELEKLEKCDVIAVPRARVCLVPKDSRGPRIISCEPAEMMFIQQGIMNLMYRTIETHPLTKGRVFHGPIC